jgi:uncharacterized membrane protein
MVMWKFRPIAASVFRSTTERQNICDVMKVESRHGNFEAGAIEGIGAASRYLANHFPKHGARRNEPRDAPVVT